MVKRKSVAFKNLFIKDLTIESLVYNRYLWYRCDPSSGRIDLKVTSAEPRIGTPSLMAGVHLVLFEGPLSQKNFKP